MSPPTRRSYLATLASATAALSGCISGSPGNTTQDETTTRPTTTDSPATTEGIEELRLDFVRDVSTIEAPVTVYPADLQSWLREAASTGETIRAYVETGVYVPEPVLPAFEYVRLDTPEGDGEIDGFYELTAEGGTRYDLLVGASAVEEVPEDATVRPVADLPAERRELVTLAIEGSNDARVFPETELGEWVRHEFFGGYYSFEGETYLGAEVQQTDAAFFSTEVWYVLTLSPIAESEATTPATVRLPAIDASVRQVVDGLLPDEAGEAGAAANATAEVDSLPEAVVQFAVETDYLLTHTAVFAVTVDR